MKIGDLVKLKYYGNQPDDIGIIVRYNGQCGAMVLWGTGEISYCAFYELGVISESG